MISIPKIDNARGQLVIKANELVQQSKSNLSAEERKLVAYVISLVKPDDDDFKVYEISAKDFAELCGVRKDHVYTLFRNIIDSLDDKAFWLRLPSADGKDCEVTKFRWFNEPTYIEKQGKIRLCLNSKIKPYVLHLKANFTKYELWNILFLKSKYSIAIYELSKSYAFQYQKTFSLPRLKELIGAETYKNYRDFRRRVLEPAISEINANTDLTISYEPVKTGKAVTDITIFIHQKTPAEEYVTYLRASNSQYQ